MGGDGDVVYRDCDVEGQGEGDLGGWGSLPISPSKESTGRELMGNWYCRGARTLWRVQGLSVPFACVGSSDPVRVLCLYTTNTLDIL